MKKLHLLLLLPAALLLANCGDNDDSTVNNHPELAHTWSLINVSGSIAGTNTDYPSGTILWTFNNTTGKVAVINNNTTDTEDFFETGTYNYNFVTNQVTPQTCSKSIKVDGLDLGCTAVNTDTLIISQVEADGYQLTFTRILED